MVIEFVPSPSLPNCNKVEDSPLLVVGIAGIVISADVDLTVVTGNVSSVSIITNENCLFKAVPRIRFSLSPRKFSRACLTVLCIVKRTRILDVHTTWPNSTISRSISKPFIFFPIARDTEVAIVLTRSWAKVGELCITFSHCSLLTDGSINSKTLPAISIPKFSSPKSRVGTQNEALRSNFNNFPAMPISKGVDTLTLPQVTSS